MNHFEMYRLKTKHDPQNREQEALLKKVLDENIQVWTICDKEYPLLLKEGMGRKAPILFVRGKMPSNTIAAVVGTRGPTEPFLAVNRRIVQRLTENGVSVLSGLAKGHDIHAHQHWLSLSMANKAKPVVVLPFLDPVYPFQHKRILEEMIQEGACVVAPVLLGSMSQIKPALVLRDHIQALLSHGVFPIEFGPTSGTLHCVVTALKNEIPVFTTKLNDSFVSEGLSALQCMSKKDLCLDKFAEHFQTFVQNYNQSFPLSFAIKSPDDMLLAIRHMRLRKINQQRDQLEVEHDENLF